MQKNQLDLNGLFLKSNCWIKIFLFQISLQNWKYGRIMVKYRTFPHFFFTEFFLFYGLYL